MFLMKELKKELNMFHKKNMKLLLNKFLLNICKKKSNINLLHKLKLSLKEFQFKEFKKKLIFNHTQLMTLLMNKFLMTDLNKE